MEERPDKELKQDASDEIREEDLPDEDVDLDGLIAQDEPEPEDTLDEGREIESNDGDVQESDNASTDADDEIGISLDDDELWDDDSGLDEIPLFEDDLEQLEEENVTEDFVEDNSATGPEDQLNNKNEETDAAFSAEQNNEAETTEDTSLPEENAQLLAQPKSWLGWLITAISSLLLMFGAFVLYRLYTTPYPVQQPVKTDQTAVASPTTKQKTAQQIPKTPQPEPKKAIVSEKTGPENHYRSSGQWEVMALAPFLIPAYQGGELVFFKVQVSLTVPDIETKRAFMRQEARIRNIIYQGLKGIEVQPGYGNVLYQYRKPLMDELNKALAPLKVIDLKLSGYLMK